jgi:CRP/FNR family transcriptional regulator, cyclic AMP receptor protein
MVFDWIKHLILDPEFTRKREFLQRVSLFKGISRREFGTLFRSLVIRNYSTGEILCREGDIGRALFILETGQVEVVRKTSDGVMRRVALLKASDYFGEMSLIDEQPRTASVIAVEPVRAYLLYKTEIEKLSYEAPHIAAAIMTHLATLLAVRLRAMMNTAPFSLDSTDKPWATPVIKVVGEKS